jgi:myosin heavy chain 9/10/11/14
MAMTANEYSTMIQKKEDRILQLTKDLHGAKSLYGTAADEIAALQNDVEVIAGLLEAEKEARNQDTAARDKLQKELDTLRATMAAKTSEDNKRAEVEKAKEAEIADLRSQVKRLQQDLSESKQTALETQNKLKLELDHSSRELNTLRDTHKSVIRKESTAQKEVAQLQASLSELEKSKRTLESELHSIRSRQSDSDAQLAEAVKAKEVKSHFL